MDTPTKTQLDDTNTLGQREISPDEQIEIPKGLTCAAIRNDTIFRGKENLIINNSSIKIGGQLLIGKRGGHSSPIIRIVRLKNGHFIVYTKSENFYTCKIQSQTEKPIADRQAATALRVAEVI